MAATSRNGRRATSRGSGTRQRARTGGRRQRKPVSRGELTPSRRKALRRRWVAVLGFVTVLVLGYVVLFTPLLGVRAVDVEGAEHVSAGLVRDRASVEAGKSLLRVDTSAVQDRVQGLEELADVEVSRSWPATIVISVTERIPIAVTETSQGFRLVDRHGVAYRTVPDKPTDLPTLPKGAKANDDQRREVTVTVLAELPSQLRERVETVAADSRHTVRFTLDDDTEVVWGDAERSARKAKVLAALLTREGSVYDVSSPDLPTVR